MPDNSKHFVETLRRNRLLIISITLNISFLLICGDFLVDKFGQKFGEMYRKYIKGVTSQEYSSDYIHKLEVFTLLQKNLKDKKVIIFAGDSLVEYFQWSEYFEDSSNSIIINRGIAGDTINRLTDRFEVTFLTMDNPQKIFIMVGINDIIKADFRMAEFLRKYYLLVDKLLLYVSPDRICVQSILPLRRGIVLNTEIKTVNGHLKSYANEKHICYIDLFDKLVDATGELNDRYSSLGGLHLTAEGYKVWLNEIKPHILN